MPVAKLGVKPAEPVPTVPLSPVEPREPAPEDPRATAPTEPVRQADEDCVKYINGKCAMAAVGPRDGGREGSGGASTGPVPTAKQADRATDHMAIGDEAMGRRDYNTAVTAYGNAMAAGKAGANVKLGEAQWRAGDQAGGGSTLMAAGSANPKAWKVLGQLKDEAGDAAGAKDAFLKYLKSNPKDAAVKARVDALGG